MPLDSFLSDIAGAITAVEHMQKPTVHVVDPDDRRLRRFVDGEATEIRCALCLEVYESLAPVAETEQVGDYEFAVKRYYCDACVAGLPTRALEA